MIRSLLARQARRHAAVLVCLGAAFMLLGAPGAGAVETPAATKAAAKPAGRQLATLAEPMPEPKPSTAMLIALGLAATAFMARRLN
ncbi:MAG: hypothetical protein EPO12_05295 [Aquabacterium sp.]|nr:MAG: hypothetical protein EPO12_05295 [Aquabacterium sp.]